MHELRASTCNNLLRQGKVAAPAIVTAKQMPGYEHLGNFRPRADPISTLDGHPNVSGENC